MKKKVFTSSLNISQFSEWLCVTLGRNSKAFGIFSKKEIWILYYNFNGKSTVWYTDIEYTSYPSILSKKDTTNFSTEHFYDYRMPNTDNIRNEYARFPVSFEREDIISGFLKKLSKV